MFALPAVRQETLVVAGTVAGYVAFTYIATEWRISIRRHMNEADTDANKYQTQCAEPPFEGFMCNFKNSYVRHTL